MEEKKEVALIEGTGGTVVTAALAAVSAANKELIRLGEPLGEAITTPKRMGKYAGPVQYPKLSGRRLERMRKQMKGDHVTSATV